MVIQQYQHLTPDQVEQFLTRGHVVLNNCFSKDLADAWIARAFERLGYDPADPSTWKESRVHMPVIDRVEVREVAPKAWGAMCDLLGSEDRIKQPTTWGDSFIVNFHIRADQPWQAPSPQSPGWHKDGDFFRHFLDSHEQGLLVIVIWSDIEPLGGGTFAACDSIRPVARFLADHPEGIRPGQFNFPSLISGCSDFIEMTGRVGDVVLIHPFVLHAASQNVSGRPRFITNPPVSLNEPMCFNREDPSMFSLVEQVVLRALGVDRLDFSPTADRERIIPERVRIQQKMLEEQKARLQATASR